MHYLLSVIADSPELATPGSKSYNRKVEVRPFLV
jgi:hypothetical protein